MEAMFKIQAATLAARQRTGDKTIGTRVQAGRVQVVRVTFNAAGKATVSAVTEPLTAADAVASLEAMQ